MSLTARLGRMAAGLFSAAALVGMLVGVPAGLATQIGWPLPRNLPTAPDEVVPQVQEWLTTPVTDEVVIKLLAAALWILWSCFAASFTAELVATVRGLRVPRLPGLFPLQTLAAWLISGLTAGVLATAGISPAAGTTAPPPPTPPIAFAVSHSPPAATTAGQSTMANPTMTHARAEPTSTAPTGREPPAERAQGQLAHEVATGDWMWHIAGRYLDDEERYPEIAALNPQYGQRYPTFPDHIQPGDVLLLPPDARDSGQRPHATGEVSGEDLHDAQVRPSDEPQSPPSPSPSPSDPASIAAPGDRPSLPAEETTAPGPTAEPSPAAVDNTDHEQPPPAAAPGAGVSLPSGAWVSLGLAALIAAVATLLRLHQRRRARLSYPINPVTEPAASPVPDSLRPADLAGLRKLDLDDSDDNPLPGIVPSPPATAAAVGVDAHGEPLGLFDLLGEVLCLSGEGALPSARAVLAAAVSTGVSEHPGARPMVITCQETLKALLPPGVAAVGLDPDGTAFDGEHLVVAGGIGEAVINAEEEMIGRRRLLEQLDVDTVDMLNADDDHAEHLPPYLLVLHDAARYTARLRALAASQTGLHMRLVLIGQQLDPLPVLHVAVDGAFTADDGPAGRLSTLAAGDLADVLNLVRQAVPRPAPEQVPTETTAAPVSAPAASPRFEVPAPSGDRRPPVRLSVLGPVRLETDAGAVTSGVRGRGYAVLALLAAHPKGRTLEEIADDLQPEEGVRDMRAALRADINSVRSTLRRLTGVSGKFLPYDASIGRYTIDPELIEVDLWRMLAAIDRANAASDDDTACLVALREAIACYSGDFATDHDRAWVIDYATTYRNHVLSAYGRIAEILEVDAPEQAAAALGQAIELDPVNEELYQRLMRIHGRQGRSDAVRRTLRLLETRLAEIGHAEPAEATRRLAARQLAAGASALPGPHTEAFLPDRTR